MTNIPKLEVHLLQMGYELKSDYDILDLTPGPGPKTHIYNGRKYICTTDEIRRIIAVDLARIRVGNLESGEVFVGVAFKSFNVVIIILLSDNCPWVIISAGTESWVSEHSKYSTFHCVWGSICRQE